MKKIFAALFIVMLLAPAAHDDPEASLQKLAKSATQAQNEFSFPVVLTTQEEDELIAYMQKEASKGGQTLTKQQAAIMVGQAAGLLSVVIKMQEAFESK